MGKLFLFEKVHIQRIYEENVQCLMRTQRQT